MVTLDYRDARPIYTQIYDGLREQILTGILQPGDKLPSVRELAATLTINPNTIQRAYEALEREGYVYSLPGKGSFVAPRKDVDEQRKAQLYKTLEDAARELLFLGEDPQTLIDHIHALKGGSQS